MNSNIPTTSTTLLRAIAADAQHARWSEFIARYEPVMRGYLQEHFPLMEADDIVQETFLALFQVLPTYRYDPESRGHFRNYLTGIVRHKALDALRRNGRRESLVEGLSPLQPDHVEPLQDDEREWRTSIYEIAMRQLLADDSVQARTKEIFQRVAVEGRAPEEVAAAYGVTRNSVDQIRNRMLEKLRRLVDGLESVDVR